MGRAEKRREGKGGEKKEEKKGEDLSNKKKKDCLKEKVEMRKRGIKMEKLRTLSAPTRISYES